MADELREKVAQALWNSDRAADADNTMPPWSRASVWRTNPYRHLADAAIAAVREHDAAQEREKS